ncbi:MAG TPA: alpha-1,2-fucosyltransferase [Verrucomicrobiae bacterium]
MTHRKKIIVSLRAGRLANRLVLFANAIALAEECGCQVFNAAFHSYAEFFKTTRSDIYCRYPVAKNKSRFDLIPGVAELLRKTRIFNHAFRFAAMQHRRIPFLKSSAVLLREMPGASGLNLNLEKESFENRIGGAQIIFVHTWKLRAPKLVQRHAQKIRDYFQPLDEFEKAAGATIETLRGNSDLVIGIHIRQGDYRRWKGGRYFFPVARYVAWMREIAAQFPSRQAAFFVCSDEPRSADEFSGLKIALGDALPIVDLLALSKCDFIIGPPSTFSQWASFYGATPMLHLRAAGQTIDLQPAKISDLDWMG